MSKSQTNVLSFDENVSYLLTLMNLHEGNETTIENRTNIGTIKKNIAISFL